MRTKYLKQTKFSRGVKKRYPNIEMIYKNWQKVALKKHEFSIQPGVHFNLFVLIRLTTECKLTLSTCQTFKRGNRDYVITASSAAGARIVNNNYSKSALWIRVRYYCFGSEQTIENCLKCFNGSECSLEYTWDNSLFYLDMCYIDYKITCHTCVTIISNLVIRSIVTIMISTSATGMIVLLKKALQI